MSFFPEKSYTYQDIGLVPRDRSSVDSRNRVLTNVQFMGMNLDMPILLAPMETVVNAHVATTVYRDLGGLAILPRLKSLVHTAAMVSSTVEVCGENTVVSIPAKDWEPWADYFLGEMGINKVCIDVANGFTRLVENTVLALKSTFPSVKIITGNIASIEGYKFLANLGVDAVRVGIGGGCFAAGTRVLMSNGFYKNIQDIKPGDRVINKDGMPVTVKRAWKTGTRKVIEYKNSCFYKPTICTPDHRHWTGSYKDRSHILKSRGYGEAVTQFDWSAAKDLDQEIVLTFPNIVKFEYAEDFTVVLQKCIGGNKPENFIYETDRIAKPDYHLGYIFGTFLGVGHAYSFAYKGSNIGAVHWYFDADEQTTVDKLVKALQESFSLEPSIEKKHNLIQVNLCYKPLADYLTQFGKGIQKHLPEDLLVHNHMYLRGLYDGLTDSNGYTEDKRNFFSSTSEQLAELFNILTVILKGCPTLGTRQKPRAGNLPNIDINNCNPLLEMKTFANPDVRRKDKYFMTKSTHKIVSYATEIDVYDIEVDCPTHSFIANNAIVHNSVCTTSLATGVGVGQASLVREIALYKSGLSYGPDIIADGGIKNPGDVCVTGDTLILMKDLTWKKAREVQPGDQIISFDENIQKVKTSGRRYYRTGTVQANTRQDLPCRTILTDKGEVTSSIDHLWLCKTTKGNALAWKKTKDLTVKDKIAYFGEPWTTDNSRQAGYLAGFFDGEGWTCKAISKNKSTYTLGVSQVVGPLGNELKELLKVYGFSNYYIEKSKTNINHQDQEHFHLTGLYNQLSFLGSIRPQRLLKDAEKLWEGQSLKFLQYASIDKIIERNSCETFSVSTTTNTFIANGFMSHNCKAIALGADLVMMGGGFAGCTESPGNLIEVDGKFYKELSGQASMKIKGHSTNVEGATKLVPYKGSINTLWTTYKEGLQSGMSYLDSKSIQEHRLLPDNYFVLLSDAAKKERQVTA